MYSPNGSTRYSSTRRGKPFGSVFVAASRSKISIFGRWMWLASDIRPTVAAPGGALSDRRPTLDGVPHTSTVTARSEYRPISDIPRADGRFRVVSDYQPAGDQPQAIDELQRRVNAGEHDIVLLGATGTGKSATTAWL